MSFCWRTGLSRLPSHGGQRSISRRRRRTKPSRRGALCPLGPHIETEVTPEDLKVIGKRNGVVVQHGRTRDLINSVEKSIAFISGVMTLEPGDVILTGTPEGIGALAPGDVFEVEIPGVTTLKNKVERAK